MTRSTLALALCTAAFAVGPATAAPPDPAAIGKQIDATVGKLASQLSAISDGQVDGATDNAEDTAERLADLYESLVDTGEPTAVKRGKAGQSALKELDSALIAIETLKSMQDKPRELTAECDKVNDQLVAAADKLRAAKDASGVTSLPQLGTKLGTPFVDKLAKLAKAKSILENQARVAANFRGADDWDKIADSLAKVAGKSHAAFSKDTAEAQRVCRPVSLGADHPRLVLVVKELRDLQGKRLDSFEGLVEEYDAYKATVSELRKIYDTDVDLVMKAMCALDEAERGVPSDGNLVAVLQRIKVDLDRELDAIKREDAALAAGIAKLKPNLTGDPDKAKKLDKIEKALAATRKSLVTAVLASPLAKGSNSPWIRSRVELGKKMHTEYQSSRCDFREVGLPSGGRLDCVADCQVVEIKPDSDKARKKGNEQVTKYQNELNQIWKELKSGEKVAGAAEKAFVGKFPAFAKCFSNGVWKQLSPIVVTYSICPKNPGQLELGKPFWVHPEEIKW